MLNSTLIALPKKKYIVMAPFINLQKAEMRKDNKWGLAKESNKKPSENWNFESTRLSEPLAKGSISMREAWLKVSRTDYAYSYQRQLLVRDFFSQFEEPPLRTKWKEYPWSKVNSREQTRRFLLWKNGETGYDMVDASMIQLKEEGFISNRQRMICASFLAKNLLVDWQRGEEYFAKELVDYNKSSNKGNWAWVSGAGFNTRLTDVMNPVLQRRKIDPDKTLVQKFLNNRGAIEPEFTYGDTKKIWLNLVT